ncbi:MAG: hypothetical protein EP319_04765 [Deltaproteobacteria bacterium]|nr:MAG: hypothetical protein EP319_04765 [Deltaproteobacteria bacterium]
MSSTITFKEFAIFVQMGKISDASMALSVILDLDDDVAEQATQHFVKQLSADPNFMMKLMGLRSQLEVSNNAAMMTLIECFNLNGANLILALQAAKKIVDKN